MPQEIERKFLVSTSRLPPLSNGIQIKQGYLPVVGHTVVRVRKTEKTAWLTIKGESVGIVRNEFEYPIPLNDAEEILNSLCGANNLEKTRYRIPIADHVWELDIFSGKNAGLVIAEVELKQADEKPVIPDWVAEEVTGDPKYYNSSLINHPYSHW